MKRYKHLPTYRYYDVKGLPLNLERSAGKYLRDYKLHGNSIQNGTPTPDTPVEVQSVGHIGKNKFNINTITKGKYIYRANGNVATNNYFDLSDYIEVHEDFTISWDSDSNYFQINIAYYDKDKNVISTDGVGKHVYFYTFTVPEGTCYVRFSYSVKLSVSGGTVDVTRENIQLEIGSERTDYEPYHYVIPVTTQGLDKEKITNIYLDEPLRKIGDYADYIDFKNKKVVRQIYEYTVTGQEAFANAFGTNIFDVQKIFNEKPFIAGVGMSNYYKYNAIQSGLNNGTSHGEFCLQKSGSWHHLFIKNTNYSNASDFKTYLQTLYSNGNPVKIYFPLATPTEETIDLPSIPTFKNTNTLEVGTTIEPSNIEVQYYK